MMNIFRKIELQKEIKALEENVAIAQLWMYIYHRQNNLEMYNAFCCLYEKRLAKLQLRKEVLRLS